VAAIENLVLVGVAEATSGIFQIVIFAGVMFFLSWQLALVSLIAVPVFWLTARAFSRRIKVASREARRRGGSIGAVAEDSLGNAVLIQAYGREQAEVGRFSGQSLGRAREFRISSAVFVHTNGASEPRVDSVCVIRTP
jgi:ATP-binding cassette, subfamily B, bacterial